jgi:hypothetical protein
MPLQDHSRRKQPNQMLESFLSKSCPLGVMIGRWIADHLVTVLRPSPASTVDLGGFAPLSEPLSMSATLCPLG